MRVVLVAAANTTDGGGEKHVADLLQRLPSSGVEVSLVAPAGGDLGDIARALGIEVFAAPLRRGLSLTALAALRVALAQTTPDVVHAHGSRAAAYARVADIHARRRVVYTLHGIHVDQAGAAARRAVFLNVERALRQRTARFVCVCRADATKGARLGLLNASRTSIVHNGITLPPPAAHAGSLREEVGAAGEAPLVLSIGRFHEQKDQATLLRAWRRVARAHPAALLVLIGSGDLDGSLRTLAESEQVQSSVRFLPPRSDIASAYVDADVFALSSRWEGLPYVILEAMAYGLPVVSTRVDGIPEMVRDGENGLLVAPGDDGALAGALLRLLDSRAERRRMGATGMSRVRADFSVERMVAALKTIYQDVSFAQGRGGASR